MTNWNWLRLATAVAAVASGAVAILVPAAAPVVGPVAAFLAGVVVRTPGHAPSAGE